MAIYQANVRRRFLDRETQEMLERRFKSLVGLMMFAVGTALAMALGSYEAGDMSWLSATDAPVRNLLGWFGASVAAILFMVVGWGGWGLALLLSVWGIRLTVHAGSDRLPVRIVVAPVWIAVTSIFAASQVPGGAWIHSFGLGGMFGDMVLGMVLSVMPFTVVEAMNAISLLLALGTFALGLYVLGCSVAELGVAGRFLGGWVPRVVRAPIRPAGKTSPEPRRREPPVSLAASRSGPSDPSTTAPSGSGHLRPEPPVRAAGEGGGG